MFYTWGASPAITLREPRQDPFRALDLIAAQIICMAALLIGHLVHLFTSTVWISANPQHYCHAVNFANGNCRHYDKKKVAKGQIGNSEMTLFSFFYLISSTGFE